MQGKALNVRGDYCYRSRVRRRCGLRRRVPVRGGRILLPVLEKGWQSLVKAVHSDGKLGYIQPVGAAPKAAGFDATDVYGVGAFLLAGSELYKLSYTYH